MKTLNTICPPQKTNILKKIFSPVLIVVMVFNMIAPVINIANAAGTATQLVFTAQPTGTTTVGVIFSQQPVVELRDISNAIDTTATSAVVLAAFSDPACTVSATGTISGTIIQTAVAGVATFSGLSFDTAGTIYLQATSTALTSACSAAINITPMGVATQAVYTTQPSATVATGTPFAQQPIIELRDGMGMLDSVNNSNVVISAFTNATCSIPAIGILTGTTTLAAISGVATFSGLSYDTNEVIHLQAASGGLISACSNAITVGTVAPPVAPAPVLTSVSIASNNASTSLANIGDTATLTFTADMPLGSLPTVTIDSFTATTTSLGGNTYSSSHTLTLADVAGVLPFTIDFISTASATGTQVSATTDSSSVNFLGLAKFVDALPIPGVIQPTSTLPDGTKYYEISMTQATQQLHRDMPLTPIWGYNGSTPAGTIEARTGVPVRVKWINSLPTTHLLGPVDTTLHGADMGAPAVRTVVHLHGGEVPATSDGDPFKWYTPSSTGPQLFSTAMPGMPSTPIGIPGNFEIDNYPNIQQAGTLWYHDHAMGATRLNVVAGLAGFYLLRDANEDSLNLPKGAFEIPIAIQDRQFNADGTLAYPNPWSPEYFGDKIMVNGKVWPFVNVEPRKYRLRLLDGSNARAYNLKLVESDATGNVLGTQTTNPDIVQIGTDGGFLATPVIASTSGLLMAPGERADVIVDFSAFAGKNFILNNNAEAPYQQGLTNIGAIADIMMFKVQAATTTPDTSVIPGTLNTITPISQVGASTRDITMSEILDPITGAPKVMLLNGQMISATSSSDKPLNNTTEIWRFINTTMDTHPMHLHLVEFQVVSRQAYVADIMGKPILDAFGKVQPTGPVLPPGPNENGWKDTIQSPPGMITSVIMHFGSFTGRYVYHCHILEHEDNDMMLPFEVVPSATNTPPVITSVPMQTVGSGTPISMQVLASDVDNNILSYSLVGAPVGVIINSSTGVISWTPSTIGTTTFTVIVSDGFTINTAPITIISTAAINAPVATPITPQAGTTTVAITIPVIATSSVGAPLTYSLASPPIGATINQTTGVVTFIPAATGTANFYILVSDGTSTVSVPVSVTVNAAPVGAPVITPIPTQTGTSTVITTIPVTATSSVGAPLTYTLLNPPTGATINPTTGIITFIPTVAGTYNFFVQASDGTTVVTEPVSVTVNAAPVGAPVITPIPTQTGTSTATSTIQVTATSSTGATLTYALLNEPAGVTIDVNTGIITINSSATGTFTFIVQATDGITVSSDFVTITINQAPIAPPIVTPIPNQTGTSSEIKTINVEATSTDGLELEYSLLGEPLGTTINQATGVITFFSTSTGVFTFDVEVSDGINETYTSVTVTVLAAPIAAPIITPIIPQTGTTGTAMIIPIEATSSTGLPLTYSLITPPTGAVIDTVTGIITFTPIASGTVNITVQVSNGTNQTNSVISVTINNAPVIPPTPPVITSIPAQIGTTGVAMLIPVEATSSAGLVLTYSLLNSPLGANINSGTGLISYVPAAPGFASFEVQVTDGTNFASTTFSLTINAAPINNLPVVTPTPDQSMIFGSSTVRQIIATDADNDILTYSLNNPPIGAIINPSSGVMTWTPVAPGTYAIAIQVSDGQATSTATINYTVTFEVSSDNLTALISGGAFMPAGTSSATSTPSVTVSQPVAITVSINGATSSVTIPQGTIITRVDGSDINTELISASEVLLSNLTNLGNNVSIDGALQWGIPNVGLQFSQPINLSIFVGTSLNGQVLSILRSVTGNSSWTSDGVSPATSTVINGVVNFTATKASYYSASHTVTPTTPAVVTSSGGGSTPIHLLTQQTATPTIVPLPEKNTQVVIVQQVLGVKTYDNGTLLKSKAGRIYLITEGKKKLIRNLVELSHLVNLKVITVSDEVLNQIPLITLPVNVGRSFGDGNLLRDTKTKKIFILGSGMRKPISSLAELKKYAGRKIFDATAVELAKYPLVNMIKVGPKAFPESSYLKDSTTKQIFLIKNGAKKPMTKIAPTAKIKIVDNDILEHYPLEN